MSKLRSPNTTIYITNIATTSPLPNNINEIPVIQAIANSTSTSPKKDSKQIKLIDDPVTPFEYRNDINSNYTSEESSMISTPNSYNTKLNTTLGGLTAEIQDLHQKHTQLMNTSQSLINTPISNSKSNYLDEIKTPSSRLKSHSKQNYSTSSSLLHSSLSNFIKTPNTNNHHLNETKTPSSKLKFKSNQSFSPQSSSSSSPSSSPSKKTLKLSRIDHSDESPTDRNQRDNDLNISQLQSRIQDLEKQNKKLTSSINEMKLENMKLANEIHQYTDEHNKNAMEEDEESMKDKSEKLIKENAELKDQYHTLSGKYNGLFIDYNKVLHDLNGKHVLTVESINDIFNSTRKGRYKLVNYNTISMDGDNSYERLGNELENEIESHKQDVEEYEKIIEEIKVKMNKEENQLSKMKEKCDKLLCDNNEMKEKNKNNKLQLSKAKQIISMNKENIIHLNNQINTLEYEKKEIQKKWDELELEYEKMKEENDSFKNEIVNLNEEIKQLKQLNDEKDEELKLRNEESINLLQNMNSEYEQLNDQNIDLLDQNKQFQKQNSILLQQNHEYEQQNSQLILQNQQYEESNNELVEKMNNFEASMLFINNHQLELQTTCLNLKEEISGYCSYIEELKNLPLSLCEFNNCECLSTKEEINLTQELINSVVDCDNQIKSYEINTIECDEIPLVNVSSPIISFNLKERLSVKNYLIENLIKADDILEEIKLPLQSIVYKQEESSTCYFDCANSIEEISEFVIRDNDSISILNENSEKLSIFSEEVDIFYYPVVEYRLIVYSVNEIIEEPVKMEILSNYSFIVYSNENNVDIMKRLTTNGTESIFVEDELSLINNNERTELLLNEIENCSDLMKYQFNEMVDLLCPSEYQHPQAEEELNNEIRDDGDKDFNIQKDDSENMELFSLQIYPLITQLYNSEKDERISQIYSPESFRNLSISSLSFSPSKYHNNYEFCIILYHPIDYIFNDTNNSKGNENDKSRSEDDNIKLGIINDEIITLSFEPEEVRVEKTIKSNLETAMTLIQDSIEIQSKSSIFENVSGKEMEGLVFSQIDYTPLDFTTEVNDRDDLKTNEVVEKLLLVQCNLDMEYEEVNIIDEERKDYSFALIQESVDIINQENNEKGIENDENNEQFSLFQQELDKELHLVEERIDMICEEDNLKETKKEIDEGLNVVENEDENEKEVGEEEITEKEDEKQDDEEEIKESGDKRSKEYNLQIIQKTISIIYEEENEDKGKSQIEEKEEKMESDLYLIQESIDMICDDNNQKDNKNKELSVDENEDENQKYLNNDEGIESEVYEESKEVEVEEEIREKEDNKDDKKEELSLVEHSLDIVYEEMNKNDDERSETEGDIVITFQLEQESINLICEDYNEKEDEEKANENEEMLIINHSLDLEYGEINEVEMKEYHLQLIQELTDLITEEKKDLECDKNSVCDDEEEEMSLVEHSLNIEYKDVNDCHLHLIQESTDFVNEEREKGYDFQIIQEVIDIRYDEGNEMNDVREESLLHLTQEFVELIGKEEGIIEERRENDEEYEFQLIQESINLNYDEELSLLQHSLDIEIEDIRDDQLHIIQESINLIKENNEELYLLNSSLNLEYEEKEDDVILKELHLDQHHIDIIIAAFKDDTHSLENSSLNYSPENEINESSRDFRNLDLSTIEYNEVSSIIPPSRILRMVNKQLDPTLSYEISELNDLVYELDDIIEEHCNMIKNLSEDKNALLNKLNKLEKRYGIYKQYLKDLALRLRDNTVVFYDNINAIIEGKEEEFSINSKNSSNVNLKYACYDLIDLKVIPIHQSIRKEDVPLFFEILDLTSQVNNLESKINNHMNVISRYELMNESLVMKNQKLSQRLLELENTE